MEPVRVDFEKRVAEIEAFFGHLKDVEVLKASKFTTLRRSQAEANKIIELEKILKANVFLLLYNLVESTIRQSLVAICDAVATEALSYSELQEQIQQLWIQTKHRNFQNLGTAAIFSVLRGLPEEIVLLSFEQKLASGGNLDARKIRELAGQYGFSAEPHYRANNGASLFQIRKRRNDLAHGLESFAECGRQYSIQDLISMKQEAVVYLRSILRNITRYVQEKQYRN
jgi:hypothetical protein